MILSSEKLFEYWYEELLKIRLFEESIAHFYPKEFFRVPIHLAIGHEGSAVGVCSALAPNDIALSYHRSHHHYLAKGGSPLKLLYELLGDERGCSGGRGGSTHLISPDVGFMGSTAIISGILPIATGMAHSFKLKKNPDVVVCFLGDAAIEEGVFFESLNIATKWKLPLLIVIEDNDLSCYTEKSIRQSITKFSDIASMFDIFFDEQDGSDVQKIHLATKEIVDKIRTNLKPAILKINVFRAHEHCGPDQDNHLSYRKIEGIWPEKDPLRLASLSIKKEKLEEIQNSVKTKNNDLFNFVLKERGLHANL